MQVLRRMCRASSSVVVLAAIAAHIGAETAFACHTYVSPTDGAVGCGAQARDAALPPAPTCMPPGPDGGGSSGGAAQAFPVDVERDRVLRNRYPARGMAYRAYPNRPDEAPAAGLQIVPRLVLPLTGDPELNVMGNVYPADVDGDGVYEFVHFNGLRLLRVIRQDGTVLWEIRQGPGQYAHNRLVHRNTMVIADLDRDGDDDLVYCWAEPSDARQSITIRDGASGAVIDSAPLATRRSEECMLDLFVFEGDDEPTILVSERADSTCPWPWVDYHAVTAAFDRNLERLWTRDTCGAGHALWPVDVDGNARPEAVFIGKYRYDKDGTLACRLAEFGDDHVDSAAIADITSSYPGLEIVAVGRFGIRLYSAADCTLRWEQDTTVIEDPQNIVLGEFDLCRPGLEVLVRQRPSVPDRELFILDATGMVLQRTSEILPVGRIQYEGTHIIQNVELDGRSGTDEVLASTGLVLGGRAQVLADWSWLDGLQSLTPEEEALDFNLQWASHPFAFDVDRDGRDEIVIWGRQVLVVAEIAGS